MGKIAVVDDEQTGTVILDEYLRKDYEIFTYDSGKSFISDISQNVPDIILLDIAMPEMNGYEVCKWVKNHDLYSGIPIIFVSAKDMLDERLKGYESGGDDFITKPLVFEELKKKIDVLLAGVEEYKSLKSDYESAFNTAMQAMSSAGELGVVMGFLDKVILCKNYDEFVNELFVATEFLGLNCTVQIRLYDDEINLTHDGQSRPLEAELLSRIKNKGRFFDAGSRTFVNFERISLLVKNMPIDEPDRYGRIKDNLPPLLNGANARICAMEIERDIENKRLAMRRAIEDTHSAIEEANEEVMRLKEENNRTMEDLIKEMDAELMFFDLLPEKEAQMHNLLENSRKHVVESYDKGMELEKIFDDILKQLFEAVD